MKKLALVLAILMMLSVFSVTAMAADVTIAHDGTTFDVAKTDAKNTGETVSANVAKSEYGVYYTTEVGFTVTLPANTGTLAANGQPLTTTPASIGSVNVSGILAPAGSVDIVATSAAATAWTLVGQTNGSSSIAYQLDATSWTYTAAAAITATAIPVLANITGSTAVPAQRYADVITFTATYTAS